MRGWGECCSGYQTIKLEKGKLFYKESEWDSENKKYRTVWLPLEEEKAVVKDGK